MIGWEARFYLGRGGKTNYLHERWWRGRIGMSLKCPVSKVLVSTDLEKHMKNGAKNVRVRSKWETHCVVPGSPFSILFHEPFNLRRRGESLMVSDLPPAFRCCASKACSYLVFGIWFPSSPFVCTLWHLALDDGSWCSKLPSGRQMSSDFHRISDTFSTNQSCDLPVTGT